MNRIEHFGAIAASDWTDDNHHRLPIPKGCREVLRCQVHTLPEHAKAAANKLIKSRPRVRKIIVSLCQ